MAMVHDRKNRRWKKFSPGQERMMQISEDLQCKATILEAGVAATFKTFGEWVSVNQAEITIEVLKEAIQLRKKADAYMEQVNQLLHHGEPVKRKKPRRR